MLLCAHFSIDRSLALPSESSSENSKFCSKTLKWSVVLSGFKKLFWHWQSYPSKTCSTGLPDETGSFPRVKSCHFKSLQLLFCRIFPSFGAFSIFKTNTIQQTGCPPFLNVNRNPVLFPRARFLCFRLNWPLLLVQASSFLKFRFPLSSSLGRREASTEDTWCSVWPARDT